MTTVELKGGYFVEIDPMNYTLKQKYAGKNKAGEKTETEKTCGYFGNMKTAIEKYIKLVQLDVMDGETLSLREYVKTIEQCDKIAAQGVERSTRLYEVKHGTGK